MRLPRALHARLTIVYAAALFATLCLFAAVCAIFLVQLSRGVLDARLRATALAVNAIGVDAGPMLHLDPGDAEQFSQVVTPRLDAAIFRSNGSIVVTTASGVPSPIREATVHSLAINSTIQTIDAGSGRLRLVISPLIENGVRTGTVAVWASMAPLEDFEGLVILVFVVAIPAVVALAAFGAGFVTKRGLAPLRDIANLATRIEASDLSRRLRSAREHDELGSLSAAFNRMLDRLQDAFERQRRFTADASHELRAPLSVIRAEADLALAREREPTEYRRALESIVSEADQLESLIGDLLALARAEGGPPQVETAVDLAPLVDDAAMRLSAVAAKRGVHLERAVHQGAIVRGDPSALARVPLALLHNGVKYARPGGRVRVTLSNGGDQVLLTVEDDGPGFTADGLRRATERFWRDDQGRGRDGTGLGLAIVRAIVEQSGGTMELRNAPGSGAEVTVRFPLDPEKPSAVAPQDPIRDGRSPGR